MNINKTITEEFKLKAFQVENTVKLIDEGNTIPFIARYRKELTGSLDDQVLRELYDRLLYLRGLDEKREQTRKLIQEQNKLTSEISLRLDDAATLAEIDDIYRPFRPKRRTRATIAKERGLEPLAELIFRQDTAIPLQELAMPFVNEEREVNTWQEAVQGAKDIIAELISDDPDYRGLVRNETFIGGIISAKAVDDKKETVYEMYYDFTEPVCKIAGHRVLALNRGEREGFLNVKLEAPEDQIKYKLEQLISKKNPITAELISDVIEDSYKRLIQPSIERDIRNELTGKAEESAIKVFSENLRQLLLQPPIADKIVMALDPGYRTGCKVAVVDETGKVLATDVVYATPPQSKIEESAKKLTMLIRKFGVNTIAIGNGTASRETEVFVADMIRDLPQKVYYVIVNEAGASVYSASKLGAEEFPDFDVSLRSAVSIGRRLQDPLAELVKIDPKSIGVGQYQHDMNQKRLGESLGGVVESCVNNVGVDLNTASPSLLSYVSGISSTVAKNILEYREQNGRFSSREELKKVKKLGPKAFEQCAGFLRIPGAENALDNSGVHPESYPAALKLLTMIGFGSEDIGGKKSIRQRIPDIGEFAEKLNIGAPTLNDIINELEKPGRDPREDMPAPLLRGDILSIEDLREGMILDGTVRNAVDFGVFVDIGVHQDGLVHISRICDRYIKHPLEAVKVGDIVKVRVISVDLGKKRISLSMRDV